MSPVLDRYESIPASYRLTGFPSQSLGAPQEIQQVVDWPTWVMPLWNLLVDGNLLTPAYPVAIRIRHEDGMFFAENDSLAVYGNGGSPEEAIQDFKDVAGAFAAEYRTLSEDDVVGLGVVIRENFLKAFPR